MHIAVNISKILKTSATTTICGSGIATVTADSNTGFVIWYDALTGGTKLGTGPTYSSPSPISTTTSYYALASSDGLCEKGIRNKIDIILIMSNKSTVNIRDYIENEKNK